MADVVQAVLTATDRNYTSTIQKAMKVTDTFAGKVKGGIGFGALLRIGERAVDGIANGVRGLTSEIDKTNATWRSFRSNMEMIGRGGEVDKVKKDLSDFAARTVYDTSEMAQTYSQLAAVGAKNTTELVKGFGMIAAAAENPKQAMKTVSTQATQMAAKPTVAWQDFKLMLEQTPAGIAQVAKAMDMTTTELVKNVQDGKIATQEFFDAIVKAGASKDLQAMAQQYKTIGQAVDGLQESLVNKLGPAYEKISQAGIDRIVQIMDLMDGLDFGNFAENVDMAVNTANGFIDSLIAKVNEAGGAGVVLKGLATGLAAMAIAPQLGQAAKALTLFNKALFGLNAGTAGLAALNPAVLFASILIGAGMLYSAFGDQIDALIEMATTKGPEIITSLGEGITSKLPDIMAKGADLLTNLINGIAANIPAIISQGANIVTTLVQGVISAIPQLIPAAFNAIGQFIIGVATALPQLITSGLQLIATLAQGIASNLPQLLASAATAVGQFIAGIGQNLPQMINAGFEILGAICQGIINAIFMIPTVVKNIFTAIKDAIKGNKADVENAGQDTGKSLTESVAKSAASGKSTVANAGKDTGASFASGLNNSMSAITVDTNSLQSALAATAPQAQTAGQQVGTGFGQGISNTLGSANVDASGVISSMQGVAPQAQSAGQQVGAQFASGVQSAAPQAQSAGQQLGQQLANGLQGTQGQVSSASSTLSNASTSQLSNGYGRAYSAGAYISQGMAAGMRSALGSIRAAAAAMSAAADQAMRAKAKIHSPSRVTMETGAFMGEGLIAGLVSKIKAADTAGQKIVASMLKKMKSATKKGNFEAIGSAVSERIANTITARNEAIGKSISKISDAIKKSYEEKIEGVQEFYQDWIDSIDSSNKDLRKAIKREEKATVNQLRSIPEKISNQLKGIQEKLNKAYDKAIKTTEKKITALAEKYQAKYDKIIDARTDFANRLKDIELYNKDDEGKMKLVDFVNSQVQINKLSNNLKKLKNVLPRGLMDEIVSMDTQDALAYTNQLLGMSTSKLKQYGKQYSAYTNRANAISKSFYADRVKEVKTQYTDAVNKEFEKLEAKLSKVGQQTIQGFANGMRKNKKLLDSTTKALVNSVIANAKKILGIHSPSKVFKQIGLNTGEGFLQGIDGTQRQVQASIDNILQAADFNKKMANRKFNGTLSDEYDYTLMAKYEIEVPLVVNGREFARATADDITAVQSQKESYSNRKRGIR